MINFVKEKLKDLSVHKEFFRYGLVSIVTYSALFGGMYLFVEVLGLKPPIAYPIVYAFNYVLMYQLTSRFVFQHKFVAGAKKRFIMHSAFFWVLGNIFFNILFKILDIHYLIQVAINSGLMAVIRFGSLRTFVFKKEEKFDNASEPVL